MKQTSARNERVDERLPSYLGVVTIPATVPALRGTLHTRLFSLFVIYCFAYVKNATRQAAHDIKDFWSPNI